MLRTLLRCEPTGYEHPETKLDKMKELEKMRNSIAHSQESLEKRTKK